MWKTILWQPPKAFYDLLQLILHTASKPSNTASGVSPPPLALIELRKLLV